MRKWRSRGIKSLVQAKVFFLPHHSVPLEWCNISCVGYVSLAELIHSILGWFGSPWNCLVRVWMEGNHSVLGSMIGGKKGQCWSFVITWVIKWYSEEKEILYFIIKEDEVGQLAERWVNSRMDLFSPDSSFHVEMPLFSELLVLDDMDFSPVTCFILGEWELWELEISFTSMTYSPMLCCLVCLWLPVLWGGRYWVLFGHHSLV